MPTSRPPVPDGLDEPPADGDVVRTALTIEPTPGATAERRLMRAVLVDAIEIYLSRIDAESVEARRELAEVRRWFRSGDRTWPFSFERVCEALDLDPERVRAALRAARERRPRRAPAPSGGAAPAPRRTAPALVDSAGEPFVSSPAQC